MKEKPKYTIPLHCIKLVDKPKENIIKQYKKLKQYVTSTMMIEFNLNARFGKNQQEALNRSLTPSKRDLAKSSTLSAFKKKRSGQSSPGFQNSLTNLGRRVPNEDSFRLQQAEQLDERDQDKYDDLDDDDGDEDGKVGGKKEKKGTWFFSFENPSNCTHWIKRIESAIEAHVTSHMPKKRVTGFSSGLNDSSDLNQRARDQEIELDPPPPQEFTGRLGGAGIGGGGRQPHFQAPQLQYLEQEEKKKDPFQFMSDDSDDDMNPNHGEGVVEIDQQEINTRVINAIEFFEQKERRENKSWDLKFQNLWGNLIEETEKFEEHMAQSERMMEHIGSFRAHSQRLVIDIVDKMHLPKQERVYVPMRIDDMPSSVSVFCKNEEASEVYIIDNVILKLTHNDKHGSDLSGESQLDDAIDLSFRPQRSYFLNNPLDKYEDGDNNKPFSMKDSLWKKYGRQFLALDILFDTLFLLSRKMEKNDRDKSQQQLRVPLACLVDYKGQRALAIGKLNIEPNLGVIVGFSKGRYQMNEMEITRTLRYAGELLNLKPNKNVDSGMDSAPISMTIEVYDRKAAQGSDQEPELGGLNTSGRAGYGGGGGVFGSGGDGGLLGGDVQGSEKEQHKLHFMGLEYRYVANDMFYVINTSEILPHDLESTDHDSYLRPEFVAGYEKALCSDTSDPRQDDSLERFEVKEASRDLKNTLIPQLVSLFDSLTIIPIDSESLTRAFHQQGVNMRYLGAVASKASLLHVRTICTVEMIARTIKRIIHNMMNTLIRETYSKDVRSQVTVRLPPLEDVDMDRKMKLQVKDYLTLLFGKFAKEKRDHEWRQVKRQVHLKFRYAVPDQFDLDEHLNAIFFSVQYHLNFVFLTRIKPGVAGTETNVTNRAVRQTVTYLQKQQPVAYLSSVTSPKAGSALPKIALYEVREKIELGKNEKPFESEWTLHFRPRTKIFQLRNVPYIILAQKCNEFRQQYQNEQALKSCMLALQASKLMRSEIDADVLIEIGEILMEQGLVEEAIEKGYAALGAMKSGEFSARAVKVFILLIRAYYSNNQPTLGDPQFNSAVTALEHHWGSDHPTLTILYSVVAFLIIQNKDDQAFEKARILYQTALNCCTRVLGANHIQTAEIYMDFGSLYMLNGKSSEALTYIQKAYSIYDSYFGREALPTANAAFQLAGLLEEQGNLKQAVEYAIIASTSFSQIYGKQHEISIHAVWLLVSVLFTLQEYTQVEEQVKRLYGALQGYEKRNKKKYALPRSVEKPEPTSPLKEEEKTHGGSTTGPGGGGEGGEKDEGQGDQRYQDRAAGMRGVERGGISFRSPNAMLQYTNVGRKSEVIKKLQESVVGGLQAGEDVVDPGQKQKDSLELQMEIMKENCVVAAVLNRLIMLTDSQKRMLQKYLEALLAEEGEIYVNYIATLKKGVSSMGKVNIRNVQLDEEAKMIMHELFNMANIYEDGISGFFRDKVTEFMNVQSRKVQESAPAASGSTREVGGGHNEGELANLDKPYDETTLFLNLVHSLKSLLFSTLMPENKDSALDSQ